jgi:hypothetical protein
MTTTKYLVVFGGILIGLFILMAAGVGVLALLLNEASEDGELIAELTSLMPFTFTVREGLQANEGDEFTGQTSGWLFGIGSIPVLLCLVARFINRRVSAQSTLKNTLAWFTRVNNKYFMPFHTYLSILALGLAILHLLFSSCPNPFPEWGLIIAGILVVTGLIIKLRIAAKIFPKSVKYFYQFHASLVVSGILVSVLLIGHTIMD